MDQPLSRLGAVDFDDEMDMLEETYQLTTVPHEEEVEVFARYLDDCRLEIATASEACSRLLELVGRYSDYASDRAETVRERLRLAASANRGRGGTRAAWQTSQSDENNDMDIDDAGAERPGPTPNDTDLEIWENEAQTWDLLRRLLPLWYEQDPKPDQSKSQGPFWTEFLESIPGARENRAILEWLQQSANARPNIDEMVKDLQQNADRGDILAHGWLHTRTAIKMYKTHMHVSGAVDPKTADATGSNLKTPNGPMVTQLDPDVVTRQGRKLAPQDEYFERAIWLGCFEMLRRGRCASEIRDWCQERTEAWRAVSVSGLTLSLDGRKETFSEDPASLILWKRMCAKLAREGEAGELERAVYGILSGDRERVEAVSRSWDDVVFAHYNAQLRAQYDHFLVKRCGSESTTHIIQLFGPGELPQTSVNIRELAGSLEKRPATKAEALAPTKSLHASILSHTLDDFFDSQGEFLAVDAGSGGKFLNKGSKLIPRSDRAKAPAISSRYVGLKNHHWIRTLCHVYIIVAGLEAVARPTRAPDRRLASQENVLAAYINYLRLAGLDELIPLYCARLTGDRRYSSLSLNYIHIADRESQVRALNLVQKMGLDVTTFVKMQPQMYLDDARELVQDSPSKCPAKHSFRILADGPPSLKHGRIIKPGVLGNDPNNPEDSRISPEDESLIRSMEWLLLVGGLVPETFDYGVKIYKYFLKYQRLVAARAFAERVSCADILKQKAGIEIQDEEDVSWWDEIFSPLNRVEGGSGLGSAMGPNEDTNDSVGVTRDQLEILARPFWELECAVRVMDCLETTAQISRESRDDPVTDREIAKSLGGNAKLIKGFMKPLLKDWLLTTQHEDKEFVALRETYLPDLVIGYASTLHIAGTSATRDYLLECMDLAALIAEEGSDLAALLVKTGRMKELLESFASCSKALAIWTTDLKKGGQGGSNPKKYRETGWSRELWTVKN